MYFYKLHYVGCPNVSTYFWSTFMLEYLYSKKEKVFNGFHLPVKILRKVPEKCLPYMASMHQKSHHVMKWNEMDTPNKRIEYILEQIGRIAETEQFEPMVCQ